MSIETCRKKYDIKLLVSILQEASDIYHNKCLETTKMLTDSTYDIIKDILEEKDPGNKELDAIGASVEIGKEVVLPFHMGSLDKIKDAKKINNFLKDYKGPFLISDKLDGFSVLIQYSKDGCPKLYSRGNGDIAKDISHLAKYLKLPKTKDITVRGEMIFNKKDFKKLNSEAASARNAISSVMNKKEIDKDLVKNVSFVAYNIYDNKLNLEEQYLLLKKKKFIIPDNIIIDKENITFEELSKCLLDRRENSEYDIDGIVITDNNLHEIVTKGNPKHSKAFKLDLDDQIRQTKVIKVEWNVSKHGLLKPRIIIEEVEIGGSKINKTTGKHAKFIYDNNIGPGAIVNVIKSGDVIPNILNVIKKAKKGAQMPDLEYEWNETETDIILIEEDESSNQEIIIKNIVYFFKKLNTKELDIGIITKLVENNINTLAKILDLEEEDYLELPGIKEKMANKLYTNIQSAIKNVKLETLMAASNIFGMGLGEKKLKLVVENIPDIISQKISNNDLLDLIIQIDGFSTKTGKQFVSNLSKFLNFLDNHPTITLAKKDIKKKRKHSNDNINGAKIVFTGFRDKELEETITELGGNISTSVSKNTNYLIIKDKESISTKITKAKESGVNVIILNDFKKLLS